MKTQFTVSQSPIQLLLPPGLCSIVCPILTTPVSILETSPTRFITSFINKSPGTRKGLSIASTNGLGGTIGVVVAVTKDPCPSTLGKGPTFGVSVGGRSTGRNDSAYHSYHTWRSSVRRQMETRSSELLGKYNGSYQNRHSEMDDGRGRQNSTSDEDVRPYP